jgi:hypothetical protein
MLWVIAGVSGWIALFILKEERSIWKSFIGGLLGVIFQLLVDINNVKLNLYQFHHPVLPLYEGINFFYVFGIVFSMGTIFTYHLPAGRKLKLAHIFIFSLVFFLMELILSHNDYFILVNWSPLSSLLINVFTLTSLAFFTDEFNLRGRVRRW